MPPAFAAASATAWAIDPHPAGEALEPDHNP
jgi:hypothetical protein